MIGANTANASTSEFIGVIGAAIGNIKNQNNEKLINGSKILALHILQGVSLGNLGKNKESIL